MTHSDIDESVNQGGVETAPSPEQQQPAILDPHQMIDQVWMRMSTPEGQAEGLAMTIGIAPGTPMEGVAQFVRKLRAYLTTT